MNDHLVVPVETISSREAARTSMTKAQTDTTDESNFASLFEVLLPKVTMPINTPNITITIIQNCLVILFLYLFSILYISLV